MPTRSWQQEINASDTLAARPKPLIPAGACLCLVCSAIATQWIRSTSQRFSAPRCDRCGDGLVAHFRSCGVKDVTVDGVHQPESVRTWLAEQAQQAAQTEQANAQASQEPRVIEYVDDSWMRTTRLFSERAR